MSRGHAQQQRSPARDEQTSVPQFTSMFSPATFYDVLHAPTDEGAERAHEPKGTDRPFVVAFYGFKGGAGRTMALAHTAALLAQRGARVVAIDLDLEAPGLDVVLGKDTPEDIDGTAALLRQALVRPKDQRLDVPASLQPVDLPGSRGALWVLPAGRLNDRYLATIEELNVPLWHTMDAPQPLQRVLTELSRTDIRPDAIFLDCRTGFHGLSATALFHIADLIVVCFSLSPQMWDGLDVIVKATRAAQLLRRGAPDLLLVPTLVPPSPVGKRQLDEYVDKIERAYARADGESAELSEDPDTPHDLCLEGGIPYDSGIAVSGRLDPALRTTVWGHYRALSEQIAAPLALRLEVGTAGVLDTRKVLDELKIDRRAGFADGVDLNELIDSFVPPGDLVRLLDRATALIVGAKGAGKTWLFRYLVGRTEKPRPLVPQGMSYVVGHAPGTVGEKGPLNLSPEGIAELEQRARMTQEGNHIAFWRLYGIARICESLPEEARSLREALAGLDRASARDVGQLLDARDNTALSAALTTLLTRQDIGTQSDAWLQRLDGVLLEADRHVTLVYDGLDTGFDVGKKPEERQERFVRALLQLLLHRSQLRRIHFKTFLREDVFLNVGMQNKSHLEAAKVELRWRPEDLWRMALTRVEESDTYRQHIAAFPGGTEDPARLDETTLRHLLEPLWGATVQGGRKSRTALYVQKRTSDAAGRLFPRTLLQLLAKAIEEERRTSGASPLEHDRVLSFTAVKHGVEAASSRRIEDLKAEYADLELYLKGLEECKPVATEKQFIDRLKRTVERSAARPGGGVKAGALHAGAGGWKKVIALLKDVGVLGDYDRAKEESGSPKLAVALLYRPGLKLRVD